MKAMFALLAAVAIFSTSNGCGCCSWCLPKPQPVAVAPACPPPAPPCDPCATAPVTYAPAPVAPYTPPPQW